jgi:hypothetical protein
MSNGINHHDVIIYQLRLMAPDTILLAIGIPSWLEIPPSSVVMPPVQTRLQELPLEKLDWEDFERVCVRLVRFEADIEHCQLYGERGQKTGRDRYLRPSPGRDLLRRISVQTRRDVRSRGNHSSRQ